MEDWLFKAGANIDSFISEGATREIKIWKATRGAPSTFLKCTTEGGIFCESIQVSRIILSTPLLALLTQLTGVLQGFDTKAAIVSSVEDINCLITKVHNDHLTHHGELETLPPPPAASWDFPKNWIGLGRKITMLCDRGFNFVLQRNNEEPFRSSNEPYKPYKIRIAMDVEKIALSSKIEV